MLAKMDRRVPWRHARPGDAAVEERAPRIGDCVREGEEILVQVVKDPIGGQGRAAFRQCHDAGAPARTGSPPARHRALRRIDDEAERVRLASLCEQMVAESRATLAAGAGYIVRSAGIGAELAELREDAERLAEAWLAVARHANRRARPQRSTTISIPSNA